MGAFYIKDKLTFAPKVIWVELDYDYAEALCQKLERVNAHVKAGISPSAARTTMSRRGARSAGTAICALIDSRRL